MNENKWLVPGAIVLGFLILTAGVIWAMSAFSFQIGSIDTARITNESKLSKDLNSQIQNKVQELQAKLKAAKSDSEKNAINLEFQSFQTAKQKEYTQKVSGAVAKVAKAKGIRAVATSQSFIYSQPDLTDAVIKELNK